MGPAIRTASDRAQRAARLLANAAAAAGSEVRRRMDARLAAMRDARATVGTLPPAGAHFLQVSASYGPGRFRCDDGDGLPRTESGQEPFFGSARCHQRRASGRVPASAATVVRGAGRGRAAPASRLHRSGEYALRHPDRDRWRGPRAALDLRQEARRQPGRSRKDPAAYLAALEVRLLKPSWPSWQKADGST